MHADSYFFRGGRNAAGSPRSPKILRTHGYVNLDDSGGAKCGLIHVDESGAVVTKATAQVGDIIHITNTMGETMKGDEPRRLLGIKFRKGKVKPGKAGPTASMLVRDLEVLPYQFVHVAVDYKEIKAAQDRAQEAHKFVSSVLSGPGEPGPSAGAGASTDAPIVANGVPPIAAKPYAPVHVRLVVEGACVRVHLRIRILRKAITQRRPPPPTPEEKARQLLAEANGVISQTRGEIQRQSQRERRDFRDTE